MRWVKSLIGSPTMNVKLAKARAGEGLGFSFAGTTQAVYNDIDKTMLSHYGFTRENGFYTLAYRIVEFASAPVVALDTAMLPKYFSLSGRDMRPVVRLAIKSLIVGAAAGLFIALVMTLVAPIVPHLVGKDFSGVLAALRWLCWIPLLRAGHRMTGVALTGTGHQSLRTIAQFVVAVFNIGLNFWLIPTHGWIGAAWSSVASDGLLALLNSSALFALWLTRERSAGRASCMTTPASEVPSAS
jgi:O-antigen/teichoic acid export membrane protein